MNACEGLWDVGEPKDVDIRSITNVAANAPEGRWKSQDKTSRLPVVCKTDACVQGGLKESMHCNTVWCFSSSLFCLSVYLFLSLSLSISASVSLSLSLCLSLSLPLSVSVSFSHTQTHTHTLTHTHTHTHTHCACGVCVRVCVRVCTFVCVCVCVCVRVRE